MKAANIKVLLWDIDGTILNFLAAEKCAIRSCFSHFGLGECSDEMLEEYSAINKTYWERLERCELTKQEVLEGRFREFFRRHDLSEEVVPEFNARYQLSLGDTICFEEGALDVLNACRGRFVQCAVTNGTLRAQTKKLKRSGLDQIFDSVFISDQMGVEKPLPGFFEQIWDNIGRFAPDEVLIVGDSLTSDIRGGNNAGILTCWYNPTGQRNDRGVRIDWEIHSLRQLLEILPL